MGPRRRPVQRAKSRRRTSRERSGRQIGHSVSGNSQRTLHLASMKVIGRSITGVEGSSGGVNRHGPEAGKVAKVPNLAGLSRRRHGRKPMRKSQPPGHTSRVVFGMSKEQCGRHSFFFWRNLFRWLFCSLVSVRRSASSPRENQILTEIHWFHSTRLNQFYPRYHKILYNLLKSDLRFT